MSEINKNNNFTLERYINDRRKLLAKAFADELIIGSNAYYQSKGIRDTYFKKSRLIKSIRVIVKDNSVNILANSYIESLDKGRPARSAKVPIQAIVSWMKRVGIQGGNKVAYKIQNSIYSKGIKPRNFIKKANDKVNKEVIKLVDKYIDNKLNKL